MKVIKRDGREVPFDYTKIKRAIEAANAEVAEADRLSDTMVGFVVGRLEKRCEALNRAVSVEEIQDMIEDELLAAEHPTLMRHYSAYRLRHTILRKQNIPWTTRRSNQSILKEISPGCSLEGMMLKLKLAKS